jgi:hypothetical protein
MGAISKLRAAQVYNRRLLRWQLNNSPFLSGDTFSDLADYTYSKSCFRIRDFRSNRVNSEVVFVSGEDFDAFFSEINCFRSLKVLIVGNSDRDWNNFPYAMPPQVKSIFLQNNSIDSPEIHSLPIGLENRRLGVNGLPSNFKKVMKGRSGLEICCSKPLLTYISPTHESREDLAIDFENVHYFDKRLNAVEYLRQISLHRFVICPRGNGVDTHRFWESLYLNAYPIVLQSNWSKLLKNQLQIPFVEVESWSSIKQTIEASNFNEFSSLEISSLWTDYWRSKIRSELQA